MKLACKAKGIIAEKSIENVMATYVIGDVQGCFDDLQRLLTTCAFDRLKDYLWFTGDLVNGGSKPVETLTFVKSLADRAICVLGNHDLTLLGIYFGGLNIKSDRKFGFDPVLQHPDCAELLHWLLRRPLAHFDTNFNTLLVHAGVAPQWTLQQTLQLGQEVADVLASNQAAEFLRHMVGNNPQQWDNTLTGWDRIRCIVNYLTRMRFCTADGKLDLMEKGPPANAPADTMPWFQVPNRKTKGIKLIFGHWAALNGKTNCDDVIGLDTGCVWGNKLTMIRLDDQQMFSVKC